MAADASAVTVVVPAHGCFFDPAPANWNEVPRVDHRRLNKVIGVWEEHFRGCIYSAEITISADEYVWLLFLEPNVHVTDRHMDTIARLCEHVILVECRFDVRGFNNCSGAVCVHVASSAYDQRTATCAHSTTAVAPDGTSHTQWLIEHEETALLDVVAAAHAASGD